MSRAAALYSLNKLESYSQISALGPVGHCTIHFKRAVCISCRPCVDVHKGGGGSGPCGRMWTGEGSQKRDIFVDVINGWPLTSECIKKVAGKTFRAYSQYIYVLERGK